MLISDKYKFIVAMPTKTGSTSLRAIVGKWARAGGDPKVLRLHTVGRAGVRETTRHRIAPVEGQYGYTRYMLAREPFARFVSAYEFCRTKHYEFLYDEMMAAEQASGVGDGRLASWRLWCSTVADIRGTGYWNRGLRGWHGTEPYKWTDTLGEIQAFMQGWDADESRLPWWQKRQPGLIHLESMGEDWKAVMASHGVVEQGLLEWPMPHRNRVRSVRLYPGLQQYLDRMPSGCYRRCLGWEPDQYKSTGLLFK